MPFKKGQSGNPSGRPRGIANRNVLRDGISRDIPRLIEVLVKQALGGDVTAAKLLLDRVLPPLRAVDESITFSLGDGLAESGRNLLRALSDGRITPDQTAKMMTTLGTLAHIIESDELAQRVTALEEKLTNGHTT